MKIKQIKVDTMVDEETNQKLEDLAYNRFLGNRRMAVKHCIEECLKRIKAK